jgi:hypothetical protein
MKPEYDFSKGKRGSVVPPEPGKTRITIRLDNQILRHFRRRAHQAGGANYQTLINDALRDYMNREAIEDTMRRAVREELRRAGVVGAFDPGLTIRGRSTRKATQS